MVSFFTFRNTIYNPYADTHFTNIRSRTMVFWILYRIGSYNTLGAIGRFTGIFRDRGQMEQTPFGM